MALPIVPNIAKGRWAELAHLAGTSDAWVAIPLEATGLEADTVLLDYDDVAALLAASNNEQTTMGRKTLTNVTVTVDDTNNRQGVTFDPVSWAAPTGNGTGAILIAHDYDTGAGGDANLVPVFIDAMVATPGGAGTTLTYTPNASGALRAS